MMDLGTIFKRRSDVRFRHIQGESVVVRQSSGEMLVLNGVGGRVLELFDGEKSLAVVISQLLEEFEAQRQTLQEEVLQFAAEMEEAGLVERLGEGTP